MKTQFAEFYDLPESRIKEIWDDALIVFDTNVLLNLYRYNEEAADDFIKVIKFYKDRLWIPYQVGFEFHRRREDILRKNAAAYKSLGEKISEQLLKVVDTLGSDTCYARHPYIQMDEIKKKVERCASSISESLEKQGVSHPDFAQKDKVLEVVTELFDGHVGGDFEEKELDMLYKEGEKRYANQVPPGYCDAKNKKDRGYRSLYGDLIVWRQTIKHSSDQKRNVIFVTDDHKPDWWDKVEGKHTPRKELIREFSKLTDQIVLIYDSSRFLEYAKRNKELRISQKTINEISKIRVRDVARFDKWKEHLMDLYESVAELPKIDVSSTLPSTFDVSRMAKYYDIAKWIQLHSKLEYDLKSYRELQQSIDNVNKMLDLGKKKEE